ncbi:histidine kinase [Winogradskyella litorisediminis]|uniref:Histidine kinase n=1 Tax=Winogradskyella litorisediminis TaxID=1156618 RepID=A0ABW3N6B9_9FLAO
MKRPLHLLLPLFLFALNVSAQEPVSIHLTEENGLPDVEFYSMLEDNEGYMWLAANKGLFRYDGKEFKAYTNLNKRGRSFFNLKLDKYGNVWCNNIAGQFFRVKNDSLQLFLDFKDELNGALPDYIFFKNNLVFKARNKFFFIDLVTKQKKVKVGFKYGTNIGFVNKNNNFVSLDSTLNFQIRKSIDSLTTFSFPEYSNEIKDDKLGFTSFYKYKTLDVLLFQNKYNFKKKLFLFESKRLTNINLPEQFSSFYIHQIFIDNNYWFFSTTKGVFKCVIRNQNLHIIQHYFSEENVTATVKDFNNNLWFSTLNNGVFVVPNENIISYSKFQDVTALEKKNDSVVYVGELNGKLSELSLNSSIKTRHSLSSNSVVRQLHYDDEKLFYASDQNTYLYNEITNFKTPYQQFAALKSVDKISDTSYVIGKNYESSILNKNSEIVLEKKRAYKAIYSERNKSILLSSVNGLDKYDYPSLDKQPIYYDNKSIYAFDLTETKNGIFWAATYSQGVFGIKDGKVIKHLKTENGLASNTTSKIAADGSNLWIATDLGLQFYNSDLNTFQTLSRLNGLNSFNINQLEVLKNHVVFSSNLGLFSLQKDNVFQDKQIPKVEITSVTLNETPTILEDSYTLKQTESEIAISFHSKGFQSDKTIDYYYKLYGFDENYKMVNDASQEVKYNSLPAGNFTFKVKAKNKFANNFSQPAFLKINVVLPFYKTWWFWALVFSVAVVLVIWYFKKQTNRLKKEQQIELEKAKISKDLVFSQLENLRSQMNPHFIFNALNSIQDYIITNEKKLARQYLVRFSRLIRTYLEHSQKNRVSLSEELNALNLYLQLEKDRFEDDFEFEISVDKQLNTDEIFLPSLFIQPYVENALKHGLLHKSENKNLKISFVKKESEGLLICKIRDNGIGREASAKIKAKRQKDHRSFATSANQKRIDLLNKSGDKRFKVEIIDLKDTNNQSLGTEVVLQIPM